MDVTSANFNEILPEIEEVINNATFLAIDCEFSGLNKDWAIKAYDTPKQYYEKFRSNCKEFLVIQYGISAFRFDPAINGFKQQSYNFYIFRKPINRNVPDQRFLCQSSSIIFLIKQGFDFNKLFLSGISYLNVSEEGSYREKLEEQQKLRLNQSISQQNSETIPIPEEVQGFIDGVVQQIEEFLSNDREELELPKCNAFIRRLIYQTADQKYKNKVTLKTRQLENNDRIIFVTKFKSREEQAELDRISFEEELAVLDDLIGFTKVMRMIIDSGKLVVGHNVYLDLLHTIDKFLTPLPEDYEEFKQCAHSLFGNILDTKFMASSGKFQELISSTILADVLKTVSEEPFSMPVIEIEGQGYSIDDKKQHEAGYDAYITGLSFISMWGYLGSINDLSAEETFKDFKLLGPYLNKLFLMFLRDNQYVNLNGKDPKPPRDHVFYLTFPKEWKLSNINELFSPFGGVYVSWMDDSSAYVGLRKPEQASLVLSTLSQSDIYSIMTYSRRQAQLNSVSPPPPPPSRKRSLEATSKYTKKQKLKRGSTHKVIQSIEDMEVESGKNVFGSSKTGATKTCFIESDSWD